MFVMDAAPKRYLQLRPRGRGWGRILLLAAALLVLTVQAAYGSAPVRVETVVVAPGDSVWSIAQSRYGGDPRPHVDAILRLNHLTSPILIPGQSLQIPAS